MGWKVRAMQFFYSVWCVICSESSTTIWYAVECRRTERCDEKTSSRHKIIVIFLSTLKLHPNNDISFFSLLSYMSNSIIHAHMPLGIILISKFSYFWTWARKLSWFSQLKSFSLLQLLFVCKQEQLNAKNKKQSNISRWTFAQLSFYMITQLTTSEVNFIIG